MRNPNTLDANDPLVLDRLVDGELTDAEERDVIAQLSQSPDGWRRCALAFLEARCWQRAAQHVLEITDPEPSGKHSPLKAPRQASRPATKHDPTRRNRLSIHWPGALALSALFLLAFGVGTFLPSPWGSSIPQPAPRSLAPLQLVDTGGPATQKPTGPLNPDTPVDSQDLLLGNLTLVDNSGGQFEVPVYDWNPQVADELMYRSQALSPEFFQHLKRHRVRSHQSYLPVKLQDGRQVVVPIQELEIVPVGGTAY